MDSAPACCAQCAGDTGSIPPSALPSYNIQMIFLPMGDFKPLWLVAFEVEWLILISEYLLDWFKTRVRRTASYF